jgi:DNA-binding transcriptional LysR family regulator
MNLRFVEAYFWVVSLKSVSRAAEKLHLTQSAMSARISALEQELGTLLIDRRDKQFRLTVAGLRFFTHAQKLLDMQRRIRAEMQTGAADSRAVSLRIGVIESVLHSWLIDWLHHMRQTHPDFELELTVETTPVLVDHVRRGALDLVFCALPAMGDGVRSRSMAPMDMVFAGHAKTHRKRSYDEAALAEHDLLTFQRGSQPHAALTEWFRGSPAQPRRIHNISSISAMVQLVEGGFGIATLPRPAVEQLADRLPVKVLRTARPLLPLPMHASFREDPSSSVAEDILDEVQAFIGQRGL